MPTSVLVLEDDLNMQELLVECMEDAGYEARGAPSADVALELARQHHFDLVISDVRMAGSTDGLGALAALKADRPDLRCIVITGYADEDAPKQAIEIQVDDYVHKPFTFSDLLTTVRRVLTSNQERTGYRKILASLAAAPRRLAEMAEAALRDAAFKALDSQRDRFLQGYYLAIRSNLLPQGAALEVWDRLEPLELDYPTVEGTAEAKAATEGYRQLVEAVTVAVRPESRPSLPPRTADQVDKVTFGVFFLRVRGGQISAEQLRVAASVRRSTPQERASNPALQELFQLLWGQ